MPPNPWSPTSNSQYLSTVLNDSTSGPIPSHAAGAPTSANTPPRPRPSSAHFSAQQPQSNITPAQRSAQARGKPFSEPRSVAAGIVGGRAKQSDAESYAERERRNEAAAILDSQELLIWYAAARNESVSQTRRWFENVVFGVGQPQREWREEWEVKGREDVFAASPKGKGKAREGGTPKKRYSAGRPSVVYGEGSGTG